MAEAGDVKPKIDPAAPSHVNIRIREQDGQEITFKIKRSTPMRKVMDAFATRKGVSVDSLRFVFDGVRLTPEQTPEELNMEETEQVDVMLQQLGGSCASA